MKRRTRATHLRANRTRVAALPILVLLSVLAVASAPPAAAAPRSVDPALAHVRPGTALSDRFLSRDAAGHVLVDLFIEGDVAPGLLRARGIEVNTVTGRLMTARCPLGLLRALLEMPGVDRVRVSEPARKDLDVSVIDAHVDQLRTVSPPNFSGQTGQGIVIGDVDTGLDIHHPDFQHPDGTTRILYLWDQTATTGTPPSGFSYGAEYDAAAIDAGTVPETDTDGHGSHVLGIAGGNGSGTGNGQPAYRYVGVAPEADLVMVKTTFDATSIVDGVSYVFQKAAALGERAVVNLSLSTQDGPHDGTTPFDMMMNGLTGPGRIIVASAGNTELNDLHARLDLAGTTPQSMTLDVPTYTANAGTMDDYLLFSGWYPGADQISMTIHTPTGTTIGPIAPGDSSVANDTGDGFVNAYNATTAPPNGDHEIYVEIYDEFSNKTPATGTWTFTFTPTSLASTGIVDMYLYVSHLGDGASLARWIQGLVAGGVIGSPGLADSVIAVGAHTTKACWTSVTGSGTCWNPVPTVNDLAPFSSQGPRRDGVLKPDLTAPGYGVASTKSANSIPATTLVMQDSVHVMLGGTSMAAPHVAGTVALLLAQPAWSDAGPGAIKARLTSTARADAYTGSVPNVAWGYGKLDAAAAAAPLLVLSVPHPAKGAMIPPGKPDSVEVVVTGGTADSVAIALSIDGGATYPFALGTLTGVAPGTPRALDYFVDASMVTTEAKVRATAHATGGGTVVATSDSLFVIGAPAAVEAEAGAAAPRFALDGARPNPFNPSTTIAFELPGRARAVLRVYSIRGTLVRTLVDEPLGAGRYRAAWDGRDDAGRAVASGIYLYRLDAGARHQTRKMSLLK
ncbi:MAG: S8 family serine peptidase [Hyphomicrobiales bacterium]